MAITSGLIWFLLILFLVPLVAGIAVQIYLSRRRAVWPGLILPLVGLVFSLMMCFRFSLFIKNGTAILLGSVAGFYIMLFFLLNIPSAIFLGAYVMFRKKYGKLSELRRMNIEDL